jgi:hypothetical protein
LHTEKSFRGRFGALSLGQVAKDLSLIAMGMSRRGAFDFGLAGAAEAAAQLARRAILKTFELHSWAAAAALRPGLVFAMNSQAGGT